jgi:type VI secretion system protein ImpK
MPTARNNESRPLAEISGECFMLIQQLRLARNVEDGQRLRSKTLEVLARLEREARDAGFDSETCRNAKFPLVAFLDEAVTGLSFLDKDVWLANPLQSELFGTNSAGEEFFRRLEELRRRPHENLAVLEIYYLCLVLGFKGKYHLDNPEGLRQLIEETKADIFRTKERRFHLPLSPHGTPEEKIGEMVTRNVPGWLVAAAAGGISVLVFLVLSWLISGTADSVKMLIETAG